MRKNKHSQNKNVSLKRKFISAAAMLLISAIMLTMVSFAWLTMSVAPEVSGITTNIGANGSLEIALLTSETRMDLSKIKTAVGQSLANAITANNTWGNLVDLADERYGLGKIALLPARLSAQKDESNGKYIVNSGLLSVPTYGYDGRVISVTENAITGTYNGTKFSTILGTDKYGVRAIGTSSSVSVQASALALAKTNILAYTNSAKNEAKASIDKNINLVLMNIVLPHSTDPNTLYNDSSIQPLKDMVASLESSLSYVDLSLRYGLVAAAASEIANPDTFVLVRDEILNTKTTLKALVAGVYGGVSISSIMPADFAVWLDEYTNMRNDLTEAQNILDTFTTGTYTWVEVRGVMDKVMNLDGIYIDDTLFNNMSASDFGGLMGSAFKITLGPDSGIYAQLADFAGDIETTISFAGSVVDVRTLTDKKPVYLVALYDAIKDLEAADGTASGEAEVNLTSIYGYVIDLGFRCNAATSDLLLQTEAMQRIYDESISAATMGGGSYMQFSTAQTDVSLENIIRLMDAVRVAFVDDQGNVLGIAKLNMSNRAINDDIIKAPLYLYEYSISEAEEDKGALIMGERRKFDNTIVSLERNVAKAVSAVVWLDGDLVDNTMVSAESETTIGGLLNLQFASSADLVPADNSQLLNISTDKNELSASIDEKKAIREAGRGKYTTVSWNEFVAAYDNAVKIAESDSSTPAQVAIASKALINAYSALAEIDLKVLETEINKMREFMGQTTDPALYILDNETGKYYYTVNPYTEEQADAKKGVIYRVNYENNLNDEGGGAKTPIYTDASWSNLASALYQAEMIYVSPYTTDVEIDSAIEAMAVAYDALERRVFYVPYDYNGMLYYLAISEEKDTYGKWYDPNFKRIVSDLRILELDAKAVPAEIAKIIQNEYVKNIPQIITPTIQINDDIYSELKVDEILAIQWEIGDAFTMSMTNKQRTYINDLIARAAAVNVTEGVAEAQKLLEDDLKDDDLVVVTREEAEAVIAKLEAAVLPIEAKKAEDDLAASEAASIYMIPKQRELLTKAVSVAKAINGYNDIVEEGQEDPFADLRLAVTGIETLLVTESPLKADAQIAIDGINVLLVKYGEKEVTEYNTVLHTLPIGSEVFEVVNSVDITMAMLYPTTETYATSLEAIVLTRNGIVFTAKQTVTVYAPAVDPYVEIVHPTTAPEGGTVTEEKNADGEVINTVWDRKMNIGTTTTLGIGLVQATYQRLDSVSTPVLDAEGNQTYDAEGNPVVNITKVPAVDEKGNPIMVPYSYGETIKSCSWSSSDFDRVQVEKNSSNGCVITAVQPVDALGNPISLPSVTVTIRVSVETHQGNTYTSLIEVTVN